MDDIDDIPPDRIRVRDKIVQQMFDPTRRKQRPTSWAIKGELFLNCSCAVFCPCVVSLGRHPPTEGYCHTWVAIAIDEGHFEGEDLGGINVGILAEIPGRMSEGNWKVAVYIDEKASQKAYNGLLQILSGGAGGTVGLFNVLVSEIIGAEREKVEIVREGNRRSLRVGRKIQGEIEMLAGKDGAGPVTITNSKYWVASEIIVARGLRSRVRDYGRNWDFEGKSAEICAIDWHGPDR